MNQFPHDVNHAIANDKLHRFRSEADSHRLAKAVRSERPSRSEVLSLAIAEAAAAIGQTLKRRKSKPTLPAV